MLSLPCSKAAPEVALEAGCGLVALLGGLGEKLQDEGGDHGRHRVEPLARRRRPSGDMAVEPFHRIGRSKRQRTRDHLVERDAECVEIAAGVNRTVHSSSLLGRHIGERAQDRLGRRGRLPLARQTRSDAETSELDRSGRPVHQDVCRLDVLVDEAAPVDLCEGRGGSDGEAQKTAHFHGRTQQPVQRLVASVREHQHSPTAFANELERSHRPLPVQVVLQPVFAS